MNEPDRNKCTHVQGQLHFLNSLAKNDPEFEAISGHLRSCGVCKAEWQQLQALLAAVSSVRVPAMRPEFRSEAFAQVHAQQTASRRIAKPIYGLAASVVLAGVIFVFTSTQQQDVAPAYDLVAAAPSHQQQARDLRIAFNSPGELNDVGIEIILPESVNLVGSDRKTLSWNTNLYKGKNELKLPLMSAQENQTTLDEQFVLARLTHGDKVKEFRVRLMRSEQV